VVSAIDQQPWSRSTICYKSGGKDGFGICLKLWWSEECYHGKGTGYDIWMANFSCIVTSL